MPVSEGICTCGRCEFLAGPGWIDREHGEDGRRVRFCPTCGDSLYGWEDAEPGLVERMVPVAAKEMAYMAIFQAGESADYRELRRLAREYAAPMCKPGRVPYIIAWLDAHPEEASV